MLKAPCTPETAAVMKNITVADFQDDAINSLSMLRVLTKKRNDVITERKLTHQSAGDGFVVTIIASAVAGFGSGLLQYNYRSMTEGLW